MNISPEAWLAINTAIGAFTTIALAVIALFQMHQSRKLEEVKKIVDGPLSIALKSNEVLTARIADLTQQPSDVAAALKAKTISENRQEGKETV